MAQMTKAEGRLLGRQAAADYLGINPRTLERLVSSGRLAPVRLPGVRRTLFERADLDRLVVEEVSAEGRELLHGRAPVLGGPSRVARRAPTTEGMPPPQVSP